MAARFRPGSAVFAKDGRRYVVELVEDGIVYCISDAGAETEFPEALLVDEAEWAARSGARPDRTYATIRQSKAFAPFRGRLDPAAAAKLLAKAERLVPGMLDFTAFVTARRALADAGIVVAEADLSIVKCRAIFDEAPPESRAAMLAALIGSPPHVLVGAVEMGDNLLRAMLAKADGSGGHALDAFRARARR